MKFAEFTNHHPELVEGYYPYLRPTIDTASVVSNSSLPNATTLFVFGAALLWVFSTGVDA